MVPKLVNHLATRAGAAELVDKTFLKLSLHTLFFIHEQVNLLDKEIFFFFLVFPSITELIRARPYAHVTPIYYFFIITRRAV